MSRVPWASKKMSKDFLLYMKDLGMKNVSNLISILRLLFLKILLLDGYLSPPTRVPPIAALQHLLEHHLLVLFESTQLEL